MTTAAAQRTTAQPRSRPAETGVFPTHGWPYRFSAALAVVSALAALLTLFGSGALGGPAVSIGNARGTALVVLAVGVPALVVSMLVTARGSVRALVVWLGAAAFLLYNAQMFVFATPFNNYFLAYVAMLSMAIWSILLVLTHTDVPAFGARFSPRLPARSIAVYVWVITGLNVLLWMRTIVPAVVSATPASFLDGSGMTTNPVFVQDLAVWLPMMAVAAAWLWRRRPWGELIVGTVLVMWVIEGLSIACDQWFGANADPNTNFASAAMTPAFLVLAAIGLIPLVFYFRSLDNQDER